MILAIDPGTKSSGFCKYNGRYDFAVFTIKAGGWEEMADKVTLQIEVLNPDMVAVESFQHEGFRNRKINTSVDMGRLIERIASHCRHNEIQHVEYSASVTKANQAMDYAKGKNGHERSAYCVAVYAEGVLRMGGVKG